MLDDPLSSVLSLIQARSVFAGGFLASGDWCIAFPPPDKIKFMTVARGSCWLAVEGDAAPLHLREGDVYLTSLRRPFLLASDLSLPPIDAHIFFPTEKPRIVTVGEGRDFMLLGGHVDLDTADGRLLLESLPPRIHLSDGSPETGRLRWLIDQLVQEQGGLQPGSAFASAGLAQLVFLQILRGYLAQQGSGQDTLHAGWLRAACDARIAPVLRLMHDDPGRDWRLSDLARAAAMSRTAFALHFKAVAGLAPLTYLTQWRMRLAERGLRDGGQPIASLARSLGYTSEAAFSNAFKRVTGTAPKRYQIKARQA